MCYLIAKKVGLRGCYALQTTFGDHLVELKRKLNAEVR